MTGHDLSRSDPWGLSTRWTMILRAAGQGSEEEFREAWEFLVARYEEPIKRAVHRRMRGHPAAAEAADGFFGYLFEHRILAKVARDRGSFRAYVQGVLRRYVKSYVRTTRAGGPAVEDLDIADPRSQAEFEREEEEAWARHVLSMALRTLLERSAADGEVLVLYLGLRPPGTDAEPIQLSRAQIAERTHRSLGAVDQANFRARRLLEDILSEELSEMVASPEDLDVEMALIRRLLAAWSS